MIPRFLRLGSARRLRLGLIALGVLILGSAGISIARGGEEPASGLILFTQTTASGISGSGDMAWRYAAGSRIVAFDPADPAAGLRVLTEDFHSARAPSVSPDGRRMLFSGQRSEVEPWHIWELDLRSGRVHRITRDAGGHTDPTFAADGRVVYSSGDSALYATDPERSTATRITHHPGYAVHPVSLRDGRLLFASGSTGRSTVRSMESSSLRSEPPTDLFTMRFDGTAAELFYRGPEGSRPFGPAWETPDGKVVFVEVDEGATDGRLAEVSGLRSLHTRAWLSEGLEGSFHSVFPLASDSYLVSYRPTDGDRYGLYRFDPIERQLEPLFEADPEYHAVEPVIAVERSAPKTFESVVDTSKVSGEMYCLDADLSSLPPSPEAASPARSTVVRVSSPAGSLGEVPLEADGSFYIELLSDTPVRFETLDAQGRRVRGPSAWIWVRPGERRGCIGCHEDRELAPENRVPMAVRARPVALRPAEAKPAEPTEVAASAAPPHALDAQGGSKR